MSTAKNKVPVFRTDVIYIADATHERHRLSLVLEKGVEGWWCTALYPDDKESITLGPDFETVDAAKAYAEGWARLVHRVTEQFNWAVPKRKFE